MISLYIYCCSCTIVTVKCWIFKAVFQLLNLICFYSFIGCKLLFKHDLAKRHGGQCRVCAYCQNMTHKTIQNFFGGKLEEFCTEECMSLYTVLFYEVRDIVLFFYFVLAFDAVFHSVHLCLLLVFFFVCFIKYPHKKINK